MNSEKIENPFDQTIKIKRWEESSFYSHDKKVDEFIFID